ESRYPCDIVQSKVASPDCEQRGAQITHGGRVALHHPRLDRDHAHAVAIADPAQRVNALFVAANSLWQLFAHRGLGNPVADGRIPTRKIDARGLAYQTATSVAADQIVRAQGSAIAQRDVDAVIVLRKAGHFESAIRRNTKLVDPKRQDLLDALLRQRESVIVARGKVTEVERNHRKTRDLHHLALRKKALGHAPLVEQL